MTGLAAWVSNNSCCSEGQAAHAKSPWLCPLPIDVEWWCLSDDSMNSGILKILHTALGRSLLLSQLPSVTHITLPQRQGINYMAVAWNLVAAHPFYPFPPPACWLQAFPVTVQNIAHFGNSCTSIAAHQVSVLPCQTPAQLQTFLRTSGFPKGAFCRR